VIQAWLAAYVLTLAVELPLAAWLLKSLDRSRAALAALIGTSCTHPLLWFVWLGLFDDYWLYITTGEAAVVLLETVGYRFLVGIGWRQALGISALVNAGSYLAGVLLWG
jgi:hypothetical protein